MPTSPWPVLALVFIVIGCQPSYNDSEGSLPEVVDFNFHVKPILADRCFACHGPDASTREADLRLDEPESAIEERLESGNFAIVPGNLRKSQVFRRIISDDPEKQMPPAGSNLTLSENEVALLARWIEQGAEYKPHWSLLALNEPEHLDVDDDAWIQNPIDRFVLSTLKQKGWVPSPQADKEILIRRVTLDLTGLPPTLSEIDAFLADSNEDAYEKLVDRLLNTDAYAERMAMEWLDVARYADSHGYSQDGYRYMWPWRDWVIEAFSENMPFDKFVTWQLAGDLLPDATQEQRLATAFLRNQRINSEGGIVPAEYLVEYGVERAATVGTAFMGLTLECARCHDHKYDPISQKEFYEVYAFFNNVNEAGLVQKDGNSGPQVLLADSTTKQRIGELAEQIQKQRQKIDARKRDVKVVDLNAVEVFQNKALTAYLDFEGEHLSEDRINSRLSHSIKGEPEQEDGYAGWGLRFTPYDGVNVDSEVADFDRSDPFTFSFWLKPYQESDYMVVLIKMASKNDGYRGYSLTLDQGKPTLRMISAYPANLIEVQSEKALPKGSWSHVVVSYDGLGSANGVRMYVNGFSVPMEIGFDQLSQSIRFERPPRLQVGGRMQEQLEIDDGYAVIDELRIHRRAISELEARLLADGKQNGVKYNADLKKAHYLSQQDPVYLSEKDRLFSLIKERHSLLDTLRGVMVMDELPTPRPAYVLGRGHYLSPEEQVFPNTPDVILPYPGGLPKNRLGFAQWLLLEDHPLTARVTVNRYWQMYFGTGLVKTVEDFGNQGDLPTHPELLDWLAYTFRENGWDIKALQKLIVMSATYRQRSQVDLERRRADPENQWLARGPSHRLSAEMLRDQALAASGLLVRKIGGESVKPYQPHGLWSEKSFFSNVLKAYEPDTGDKLYRRSMYTFWRRTAPPPTMVLFDAPTRDNCTVRRQQTNTPLQALVLLNDPQFVEASRVLAGRVLMQFPDDPASQITHAYRALSGLNPTPAVEALLLDLYLEAEEDFQEAPQDAHSLLAIGEAPGLGHLDPMQQAALTVVCNTIMSFDEVVMKR